MIKCSKCGKEYSDYDEHFDNECPVCMHSDCSRKRVKGSMWCYKCKDWYKHLDMDNKNCTLCNFKIGKRIAGEKK